MSAAETARLGVLIPAWNERDNLEALLPALKEVLGRLGVPAEVVVIDGGSVDGTPEAARRLGARVVQQTERGYGGALLAGFAAVQAPYLVTMDADLSHPPRFIEEFWRRRDEAEVLIASRYVAGGRAEMNRFRLLLSVILNRTYAWLLSIPVADLSSGFRLYHRKAVLALAPVARDFDFLEEVLVGVCNRGGRVLEIPFHYMPRGSGRSHARLLKFGWAFLKTLLRMWRLRHARERRN
jgi:glycosyltransferase involved in cell wall biosynthesis